MTAKVEIDWKVLNALVQFKVTLEHVADYMGISRDTIIRGIKKEFGMTFTEYHHLKIQRTATKLQQKAIEMAINGNTVMMIFMLKNLAGYSDKTEILITDEETQPTTVEGYLTLMKAKVDGPKRISTPDGLSVPRIKKIEQIS